MPLSCLFNPFEIMILAGDNDLAQSKLLAVLVIFLLFMVSKNYSVVIGL